MPCGTIIDETILSCCGDISYPIIHYCEITQTSCLLYWDFSADFVKVTGKLYDNIEEYMFLQELMRDSFHQEICNKYQDTSLVTIRLILRNVISRLVFSGKSGLVYWGLYGDYFIWWSLMRKSYPIWAKGKQPNYREVDSEESTSEESITPDLAESQLAPVKERQF